jgi:metallo-beta-lactamase family protein
MQVIHHGGKHGVTGSCHELKLNKESFLIDCGQFQGEEHGEDAINFPIRHVCGLVLTHAHIDHVGRVPWLLAAGFDKPIYCTRATAELLTLVLRDGLKLKLGMQANQIERILQRLNKLIVVVEYHRWRRLRLSDGGYVYLRFSPAGHILGSAITEFRLMDGQVIVFSGDIGPRNTPLLPDPKSPPKADLLVLESTYGDRCHDSVSSRVERLNKLIHRALDDGGAIIIPAFSIGRTQELLFDIECLIHQHQLSDKLPIIIDSPMAAAVTKSYRRFKKLWGEEAKKRLADARHPLAFDQCVTIDSFAQHKALVERLRTTAEPAVIVAASGMCQGGRVVDFLQALLPDSRTDVILAGYQARGTLGRALQQGEASVVIEGQTVEVAAHIHSMSGYSAHADQQDLMAFVEGIQEGKKDIRLIHGDLDAQQTLGKLLDERGFTVV